MGDLNRQNAYEWYLGSEFWQAKRQQALERAGYICEDCHIRPATEVHHLTYERIFDEPATDLRALCRLCHAKQHELHAANDNQLRLPLPEPATNAQPTFNQRRVRYGYGKRHESRAANDNQLSLPLSKLADDG